jgi:hypothetical protein
MSSDNKKQRVQRNNSEQQPDLSTQYRQIGIKAVAAAAYDEGKRPADGSDDQEGKRHSKEKARG